MLIFFQINIFSFILAKRTAVPVFHNHLPPTLITNIVKEPRWQQMSQ